jgi:hypothetical protein
MKAKYWTPAEAVTYLLTGSEILDHEEVAWARYCHGDVFDLLLELAKREGQLPPAEWILWGQQDSLDVLTVRPHRGLLAYVDALLAAQGTEVWTNDLAEAWLRAHDSSLSGAERAGIIKVAFPRDRKGGRPPSHHSLPTASR